MVTLAFIPLSILLQFSSYLFTFLNITDPDLNQKATWAIRLQLMGTFLGIHLDILKQSVNSMGCATLMVHTLVLSLLLHPVWNYIFIWYLQFGIIGAAIANCCSSIVNVVILEVLIQRNKRIKAAFVFNFLNKDH